MIPDLQKSMLAMSVIVSNTWTRAYNGSFLCAALLTKLAVGCSSWSEAELEDVIKEDIKPSTQNLRLGRRGDVESDKSAQLMLLACAADADTTGQYSQMRMGRCFPT